MSVRFKGRDQAQTSTKKGGSGNTLIIVIIAAVVIAALVGVIVFLLMKKNPANGDQTATEESDRREVLVTESNVEQVVQQMEQEEYTPPGMYTAAMNFEWHFATGDSESSDSYVANRTENTNDVYFDVFLADDKNQENAIYESPVIPRGSELRNIRLKTDLDAGTYDCILVYHLIDDQQNTLSTASFTLKVIIEG